MNDRFFKQTITLFLFNKKEQNFDRFVINKVYFRHHVSTRMTDNGLINTSAGSITIPCEFAEIKDGGKAIYSYNANANTILDFILNGILAEKTWTLNGKSFVIEGEIEDMPYNELAQKYTLHRVTSVQDNRKGNLQHIKIEVEQ